MLGKLFLKTVCEYPNNIALSVDCSNLTYQQLHEAAIDFANQLEFTEKPFCLIPGSRELEDFIKIIACWLSAKPYVPLNPKFSDYRNEQIISQLSELDWGSLPNCAYIIFTSGTTGEPKGVPITFEQLGHYLLNVNHMAQTTADDSVMQSCDLSFDVSVMQMMSAWANGARLVVVPTRQILMAARYAEDMNITIWNSVPSVASMSFKAGLLRPNSLPLVRFAIFAGEALTSSVVNLFRAAAPNAQIINAYGPTEATITVCHYKIPSLNFINTNAQSEELIDPIPLGLADEGVHLKVFELDSNSPSTSLGELCIGGHQVTSGYLDRPELNQEKFFINDGVRWYRTGDLVIWDDRYGFCYKGRTDRQIKLKGYRIELQDIESALRTAAKTDLVCVVPFPVLPDGSIQDLVGVVSTSAQMIFDEGAIKGAMADILPSYMVPSKILPIDEMPLSINGKVDFKAVQNWVKDSLA